MESWTDDYIDAMGSIKEGREKYKADDFYMEIFKNKSHKALKLCVFAIITVS